MRRLWIVALFSLVWGCGGKKDLEVSIPGGIREPDKILYNTAIRELSRSRYTVARLTLQTLIDTYPDSEFLSEAKYAKAESYYREGPSSDMTQAEAEFKDFITFFPASDRADDAQLMVAMTHVKQMEKADRDSTQAQLAELEFTRMIESYPDSPLLDEAKQKLRAVQEILAEGEFKVGNTYFIRKSFRAAMGRYRGILEKYPDYSRTDLVLFNMGEALRMSDNAEGAIYYGRLITEHPFSEHLAAAKTHLTELKVPIPPTNPAAVARGGPPKVKKSIFGSLFGGFGKHPGVSTETGASSTIQKDLPKQEENKDKKTAPKQIGARREFR